MLKPLLLSRIELYNHGHLVKRPLTRTPSASANPNPGPYLPSDDGLEDVGIVLGGEGESNPDHSSEAGPQTNRPKRRKGVGGNSVERPKFGIRFGFRASTLSERGGAILVSDKNLGFSRVKKEVSEADGSIPQEKPASRRLSMQLATLEGEATTQDIGDHPVTIREEDNDDLQVSDFPQGNTDAVGDAADEYGSDDDYQHDENGQEKGKKRKRQQTSEANKGKGKGKGSKTSQADEPGSQVDQKPTLQVKYTPLSLHAQTLYIVVHSMGSLSEAFRPSSSLPFTTTRAEDTTSSAAVSDGASLGSEQQVEDEDSLFPPGMDYFA